MAVFTTGRDDQPGERGAAELSLPRSGAGCLSVFLGRFLRLVHRMGETGTAERRQRARGGGLAEPICGSGWGVALAASVHAVHHRRVVAPIAAAPRSEVHCAGCVSRSIYGVEKHASFGTVFADSGCYQGAAQHPRGNEARPEEESCGGILKLRRSSTTSDRIQP